MKYHAILLSGLFTLSVTTRGQSGRPDQKNSEQVFKNIQSMKGIPINEFMGTMGFFSASLGESCTFCHVDESGGSWDRYADDNDHKRTARRMIAMVSTMNKNFFNGRRVLTCYSCHRGAKLPETSPDIAQLYGAPRFAEPNRFVATPADSPSAAQILDKYIQALGGAPKLAALTSFRATGTYHGYAAPIRQMEIYAKAPNQRSMVVHGDGTDLNITTYDGREGWSAAPTTDVPVPLIELTGGELDGAKLDAVLSFPGQIKQALTQWRTGAPTSIDERDVLLVQGTADGRYPVNLYFDSETGLLVRMVRYMDSPVGLSPTQIDYADYREVAAVKMPMKATVSWLDGRATIVLTNVQANAAVDASRFSRPAKP